MPVEEAGNAPSSVGKTRKVLQWGTLGFSVFSPTPLLPVLYIIEFIIQSCNLMFFSNFFAIIFVN